jgi:hypothetical protein
MSLYSTNTFKAYFLSDTFYQNICEATFDVSQTGEEIELRLKHNYSAPHELNIAVPAKWSLWSALENDGSITYKFISKDKTIRTGKFSLTSRGNACENNKYSAVTALRFDLPMKGAGNDLKLRLKVDTPVKKMAKYSGEIFCFVQPRDVYK